jgi:hypothetical protein
MKNPDKNTIFKYVRTRRGSRVGVVLATKLKTGIVGVGWSLCATRFGDEFNPEHAFNIAFGRAKSYGGVDEIPRSVLNDYKIIVDRAARYFNENPNVDSNYDLINAQFTVGKA